MEVSSDYNYQLLCKILIKTIRILLSKIVLKSYNFHVTKRVKFASQEMPGSHILYFCLLGKTAWNIIPFTVNIRGKAENIVKGEEGN